MTPILLRNGISLRCSLHLAFLVGAVCLAVLLAPVAATVAGQKPLAADEADGIDGTNRPDHHGQVTTSDGSPFDDTFRRRVADTLAAWHVPGLAVAVVDGDATWTAGFGTAEFAPASNGDAAAAAAATNTPVDPDATLFYTASTTKAFVAALLSLLIDEHTVVPGTGGDHLGWATPLAAILPGDFVLADPWATTHLTVADALAHRTGLAAHDLVRARRPSFRDDDDPTAAAERNATVRDMTRSLRYLPYPGAAGAAGAPRTAFRYCNLMYLVLSHAIETLAGGQWLGALLRTRLWAPLGMQRTF